MFKDFFGDEGGSNDDDDGDEDESVGGHMLYDGSVNSHSSDTLERGKV